MHSQFNLWKTAIAIVIYVVLCILVIVFSPPDYAGRNGLVQTSTPVPAAATSASLNQEAS